MTAEVNRRRSRGRQRKRWGDVIQEDMKLFQLKKEDIGDRRSGEEGSVWLNPPLGGINSSLKEMYYMNILSIVWI